MNIQVAYDKSFVMQNNFKLFGLYLEEGFSVKERFMVMHFLKPLISTTINKISLQTQESSKAFVKI